LLVRLGKVFSWLGTPSSIRIPGSVQEIGAGVFFKLDSLTDLSFEEGQARIGVSAFNLCFSLKKTAFPASLIGIEANAFRFSGRLRQIKFAIGSQLQYIRGKAFSDSSLNEIEIPAGILEIDPSAFSEKVWRDCLRFKAPPLF
jgi:hypothetical protein